MPPHCDTRDGPVAKACERALRTDNVNLLLPWLPADAEAEMKEVFLKAVQARALGKAAEEVADTWVLETAVRLHRAGEGAPYTGIKPAGLDEGPLVRAAEKALETGDATEVIHTLSHTLEHAVHERFSKAMAAKNFDENDVPAARKYVQAMLDFMLFSHHLHQSMAHGMTHGSEGGHEHAA